MVNASAYVYVYPSSTSRMCMGCRGVCGCVCVVWVGVCVGGLGWGLGVEVWRCVGLEVCVCVIRLMEKLRFLWESGVLRTCRNCRKYKGRDCIVTNYICIWNVYSSGPVYISIFRIPSNITMATAFPSDNPSEGLKDIEEDLTCNICFQIFSNPKDLDCSHVFCLSCLENWIEKKPKIECPECRQLTAVPLGGLVNLKSNIRLRSMVEKYAARLTPRAAIPNCPSHEGERQHFFCVTCCVLVCQACLVIQHERPKHDIRELNDISKAKKVQMKVKMDTINKKEIQAADKQRKLEGNDRTTTCKDGRRKTKRR